MNLNVYYTTVNNKYGLVIADKDNQELIYAKIGKSENNDIVSLNAIDSAINFLTKMNIRGQIKKEDNVNIIFNGIKHPLSKYIESQTLNLNKIQNSNRDILGIIKTIRANLNPISKKAKIDFINTNNQEIHLLIDKAIETQNIVEIASHYNKDLNEKNNIAKTMVVKKGDAIELNTLVKLNKDEKSKIKQAVKSKKKAELTEIRKSPEYIDQMTNVLTNEMTKRINTSHLSIQEEYDLENVKNIIIYTDGSMKKQDKNNKAYNHGYGVVILDRDTEKPLFKFKGRFSKESEMMEHIELVELYAIYRASLFVKNKIDGGLLNKDINVTIMTDNQDNIHNYEKIKNKDFSMKGVMLFKELLKETEDMDFQIGWVKAHSNNLYNREADKLAKSALEMEKSEEYITHQSIIEEKDELFDITKHIKSNELHFRRKMG